MKTEKTAISRLAILGAILLPLLANAQYNYILSSPGSQATVNATPGDGIGMNSWSVDSVAGNQLDQQWFYYSINNGPVYAIDQMPSATLFAQQPDNADLSLDYYNSQISITISYSLTGGGIGSGNADMGESIMVNNVSGTAFNIQFFQYSNFNLLGNNANNIVIYEDGNGGYTEAEQYTGASGLAEAIIDPDANYAEAGTAGQVLSDINAGNGAHLTGNYNTLANLSAGPGDVAWSFEWDANIGSHDELDIAKDKSLSLAPVPEPSTIALIALGLGACKLVRRRKVS